MHKGIYALEKQEIIKRRNKINEDSSKAEDAQDLIGLACSGGGIRSAIVCLGISQVLAKRGILKQVDYLSTVSGGGYFGSFMSCYLNSEDSANNNKSIGLSAQDLPFYERNTPEPTPLRHLRNNSKYLLKGGLLGQSRIAALLISGISVNIAALLPLFLGLIIIAYFVERLGFKEITSVSVSSLSLLALLFVVGLIVPFFTRAKEHPAKNSVGKIFFKLLFALILLSLAVILLSKAIPSLVGKFSIPIFQFHPILIFTFVTAVVSFILLWINTNRSTLHAYYRNRLTEIFILARTKMGETLSKDDIKLSSLTTSKCGAPYHIINCAVNLPSSAESELRGRNSDFFIFTPKWTGSQLTGYCKTEEIESCDSHLNLGTAMSISGAAASPFMGTLSKKPWSFLLSLINVRLGYWMINPKRINHNFPPKVLFRKRPSPFIIYRELIGNFDENLKYVNLSDGGHIENLGIYELLRRRCKFIIAIDSEADLQLNFGSLNTLIRYAKIDFNIEINIDLSDFQKNKYGNCKAHFSLGKIKYENGLTGYLLYLKSSLTGNERDYIQSYHQFHTSFPHESTADQFFTEQQYEAYRALGNHMAEGLFTEELGNNLYFKDKEDTVNIFFKNLVRNLFEDSF